MLLRTMTAEDLEPVLELERSAFEGSEEEAQLVAALHSDPGLISEYNIVAEEEGRIVGHVLLTRVYAGDEPLLTLAPLAVAPDAQNRGIGTALVEHALQIARLAGEKAVLVYGDPAYYCRFGFSVDKVAGVEPPYAYYAPGWQALTLDGLPLKATAGPLRVPAALDHDYLWRAPEEG
jgi:putative acetyltransferase